MGFHPLLNPRAIFPEGFSGTKFLKKAPKKGSVEESPHSISKVGMRKHPCREAWSRCRKDTASSSRKGIHEPLRARKRTGYGETTSPTGASPEVRDER